VARTQSHAHEAKERCDAETVNNRLQDSNWIAKLWEQVKRKSGTSFDTSELRMLFRVALIFLQNNMKRYLRVVSHVVAMTSVRENSFRNHRKTFVLTGELSELERYFQPKIRLESWARTELLAYVQHMLDTGSSVTAPMIKDMFDEEFAVDVSEELIRFELNNAGCVYGKADVVGRDKLYDLIQSNDRIRDAIPQCAVQREGK